MTLAEAILLGAVQGAFMFLPVSSTAHLVLAQHLLIGFGSEMPAPDSAEMIFFDLLVHVGTLVSIMVVFRRPLTRFVAQSLREGLAWLTCPSALGLWSAVFLRLGLLAVLSVFATGVIGLAFRAAFQQIFASPQAVALTLVVTGLLLWWTDNLTPRWRGLKRIGPGTALAIGAAQGLALMPGLSRSASTIVAALFCGMKRRWAAQYSFFLAIPTILAACLVQGLGLVRASEPLGLDFRALAAGFIVAALVGIAALKIVLHFLYRARLRVFSFYVWVLAGLIAFGPLGGLLAA